MKLKRLFDVTVKRPGDAMYPARVIIVLADNEEEAAALAADAGAVQGVANYAGLVTAVGPSRVIGWSAPGAPLTAARQGVVR